MEVTATLTITEKPGGVLTGNWETKKTDYKRLCSLRQILLDLAEEINGQTHKLAAKYGYDKGQEEIEGF